MIDAPPPVVHLFGSLAVEDGDRLLGPRDLGGTRPKQVLELLLAARGHRVPTDRLADLLWGEGPPENAAGSIQTFVSVLRRHLSPDRELARELVVTEAEAYRFATDLIEFDLDRFDELHDRSAHEPTRLARRSLEQALTLVRGEVLEDEPYAPWAQELRSTYRGRVLGAHLDAAGAALAEFDYAAALVHAEAGAALDGFSERAHRTAMLALYALGRQHEALETYRGFRARLDEELGLEPTADTRALESAILRQEAVWSLLPRPILRPPDDARESSVRLLGRTGELDVLDRAARNALDGSFALLQIEGEAGLGKTRLLDELATSLVGVRVGRAGCSELERHLPYVPLATALRDALGGVRLDEVSPPVLGRILPELTLEHPCEFEEVNALEALVALIAEHAPLVLVLDDLQWADAGTVTAIDYLQSRGAGLGAAVVTAVRAGETEPSNPVRRLRPNTVVRLEPLTSSELAPLAMPDLHESTGGNPRLLTCVLANGDGSVFSTAHAEMLLDQCRAEGPWSYRLLLAAAMLEQPFDSGHLAPLVQADEAELVEALERLCEHRILRVDGFRFRFRYDLVRHVLRTSLSPARRRLLRQRLDWPQGQVGGAANGGDRAMVSSQVELHTERDRNFEQLFQDSSDPTFIIDPLDDRVLAVNQAGCTMLGYKHEELLETPVSHVHPAELPQFREFLSRVRRDGRGSTIKLTCRKKSGMSLPTEMSLHAFASPGRFYILGLVQDRSEHRHHDLGPA